MLNSILKPYKSKSEIDLFISGLIKNQSDFETIKNSLFRKNSGLFLTNKINVVNNTMDFIDIDDEALNKKILEPACGQGIFLLNLLYKFYSKFQTSESMDKFISDCLIFVDVNPKMIEDTTTNIKNFYYFLFEKEYSGNFNGFVWDFTKKINDNDLQLFQAPLENYPLIKYLGSVDHVIGNPPFISLYGRRDKKKNEAQRIYYLQNYDQFPSSVTNGKINYIMLFIEHSLQLLKRGGSLGFIVDISFFETAFQYTRKFLLEKTKILSLDINLSEFDVASGQLILKFKKENPGRNHSVSVIDWHSKKITKIKQNEWNCPDDEYKFRICTNDQTQKLIGKIFSKKDKTLKDLYPNKNLRTCTMLLDMEDKFTGVEKKVDRNVKSYIFYQGAKSVYEKFCKPEFRKYFYYDKKLQDEINDNLKIILAKQGIKNKKRIGLGETEIYENPKVYIRQSSKEIVATYDENKSAANNSLYVFSFRKNDSESKSFLKFLCGFLNSDLITFFAQNRNIIRYSKGKQPQIKTSDLYQINIPKDLSLRKKIEELTERMSLMDDAEKKRIFLNKINQLIYDYYEFTDSEIEYTKKIITKYLES